MNNSLYFAVKAFGGSLFVAGCAILLFGFTNSLYFAYGAGITASVLWEFKCVRERRKLNAAVLQHFGVPDERRVLE